MLGKLIKYEWKSTYKMGVILLAAVAIATLLGFLSLQMPFWRSLANDRAYNGNFASNLLNVMSFFSFFLYVMLLTGVVYAAFIYLVVRFYRTMYTDEGYLLHTLPVSKNQILVSKVLVSSIWVYLIYLAMAASIAVFFLSLADVFFPESIWLSLPEFFSRFVNFVREQSYDIGINLAVWIVSVLTMTILAIPASIITFYGAVSIGQLFSKHRVLMAILSYIVIMIVNSILSVILQVINIFASGMISSYDSEGFSLYMMGTVGVRFITSMILAVGCYLVSYYVTSKNLNMD